MTAKLVPGKPLGFYFTDVCNQNGELILIMVMDTTLGPMLVPNITCNQLLTPDRNGKMLE